VVLAAVVHVQIKRHSVEVSRIQAAAASERQALEQQLAATQRQLAQLQQADGQLQQQLQQLQEGHGQMQQQLEQQQAAAEAQLQEMQQQLEQADAEVQQLQAELDAADLQLQQQQQQQGECPAEVASAAAGMAAAEDAAAAAGDGSDGAAAEDDVDDAAPSEAASDAAAATEHALRAQLGIANAEVARLRHELDVALVSVRQERQLTGQEIMRLQNELSEAAEAAASASGSASGAAAAAAAGDPEVTSRCLQGGDSSGISWRSVHDNPAFEQQQRGAPAGQTPATAGDADISHAVDGFGVAGADVAQACRADASQQYEARLQDQADTILSLQQQLKQQQQLLATLQRPPTVNEHRVSASDSGCFAHPVTPAQCLCYSCVLHPHPVFESACILWLHPTQVSISGTAYGVLTLNPCASLCGRIICRCMTVLPAGLAGCTCWT
jgi:predicted  nucleic acid-binding Zn-ribbon protein